MGVLQSKESSMGLKEDLIAGLESTCKEYIHLVESVPHEFYEHPSANPAWTIGDVLYHLSLGPQAIQVEVWMIRHAGGIFSVLLNNWTSGIFNWANALFAQHPKRLTADRLIRGYVHGHTGLLNSVSSMQDLDFSRSIQYPEAFVRELAGDVTVERLIRYITVHFEVHAHQIRASLG